MKKFSVIFVLVFWAVYGSTAYAVCTQPDASGVWWVYGEMDDSEGRCAIVIASNGVLTASSTCYIPGVATAAPIRGRLFFQPNCHVFGQVTSRGKVRNIDAWISKGKDSISGMAWNPASPRSGHVISGVKQ
jgi:hypothetical protein